MFDVREQHCVTTTERLLYNIMKLLEDRGGEKGAGRTGHAGRPARSSPGAARTAGGGTVKK